MPPTAMPRRVALQLGYRPRKSIASRNREDGFPVDGRDILVFTKIEAEKEKYVRVTGHVSDITLTSARIVPHDSF